MGPRLPEQLALQPTEVVDLEDDWTGSKLVEVELEDVRMGRVLKEGRYFCLFEAN